MDYILSTLSNLLGQTAFASLNVGNVAMIGVACFFLFLAVKKGYEPLLLVPISFGMLLVNIYPPIMEEGGLLNYFFKLDEWAILPCLIFLGVGAQTDFGPLIANPLSFLLGAAAQFGIFAAYLGGWPYIDLSGKPAGTAGYFRSYCRGGLLLHVPGSDHSAADHESADDQGRALY